MKTIGYINFWRNNGDCQDRWFTHFIETNLNIKLNEINPHNNPDILISSCMGNINIIDKIQSNIKIFFYGENLNRYPPYNNIELLKSKFDIIIGFKYTDKINKIFRLPLWLCYYPYYNITNDKDNIITYLEKSHKNNIHNKVNKCSLIARHDRGGQRTVLYNEMCKYIDVLCPSKFKKNCNNIGNGNKAKFEFIKNYVYNICPENSAFEGYHTEKIFNALEAGTIPIYWAINEPEKDILNKSKYCFIKNINDNNEVKAKIKYLIENNNIYLKENIFNNNAKNIIYNYYNDIVNEIKKYI